MISAEVVELTNKSINYEMDNELNRIQKTMLQTITYCFRIVGNIKWCNSNLNIIQIR